MSLSSYRLDNLSIHLIEQLEGRRRSYQDRPDALAPAATRIADEALDGLEREYREVMGDSALPARLRREIHETFLPRYVALARDHNELELKGYNNWRRGDPISRVLSFLLAVVVVTVLSREVPMGPMVFLGYLSAIGVPFIPDIRAFYYRRGYQTELEKLVEDMTRIQNQLDAYPITDPVNTRPPEQTPTEVPKAKRNSEPERS